MLTETDEGVSLKDITDLADVKSIPADKDGSQVVIKATDNVIGGERKYSVEFNLIEIDFDIEVCDKKIETVDDIIAFNANVDRYKYVKVLNNVDLGNSEIGGDITDGNKFFSGIFDGQGYTLSNGIYKGNGLFTNLSETSVVKNVAFSGAKLYSYEHCAATVKIGNKDVNHRNTSVIGYKVYGTIDNVLIDVTVQPITRWVSENGSFSDARFGSAIGALTANTTNICNVVVYWKVSPAIYYAASINDFAVSNTSTGLIHVLINTEVGGSKKGNYSNVVVFRNTEARLYDSVDGITSDVYYYKDDTDLTTCAAADLANKGFNDFWLFDYAKAEFKSAKKVVYISTKEQLLDFVADPTQYSAVELVNDIDLENSVIGGIATDLSTYFNGTFDGKGHTISNGIYRGNGLFTNLSATSVVKNVAFRGAELYAYEYYNVAEDNVITVNGETVKIRNSSVLGYNVKGKVDNVLFDITVQPITRYVNNGWTDARWGSAIGAITADTTNITNVVVYWKVNNMFYYAGGDLTWTERTVNLLHVLINTERGTKQGVFDNVVVFRNTEKRLYDSVDGITSDVYYYKDDTDLTTCAAASLADKGFNGYWDFSGNKAVMIGD